MNYKDYLLGAGASTDVMLGTGAVDITIIGLSAGLVKVQVKYKNSDVEDPTIWRDYPGGSFSADSAKVILINEPQVSIRLVGVANNAGVYVRMGKP